MWNWFGRPWFGVTDVTRGMWGRRLLDGTRQDLRYGLRLLVRHRLFAVFSIISLALGITPRWPSSAMPTGSGGSAAARRSSAASSG